MSILVDLALILFLGPIGIIIVIYRHVAGRGKNVDPASDKEWYLRLALSREDVISQFFLLLSVFFFGVTLLALNRDMGDLLSWRMILFITAFAGLLGAYYLKTFYCLAFSLIGIAIWWSVQGVEWIQGKNIAVYGIFCGFILIALLFYVLGHLHEREMRWKRFALVYSVLGIVSITGALFFFSTKPGLSVLGDMTKGASFFGSWQITLSLLLFLVFLAGALLYATNKKLIFASEAMAVLLLAVLFIALVFLPQQTMFLQEGRGYDFFDSRQELSSCGVGWATTFNFAVFFELLGLIFSGYLRRETWLINCGAIFLFLLIIVKYFDWFFTFLDKSIFFIGAGVLLFAVGWFMEKGRRYMIDQIKT